MGTKKRMKKLIKAYEREQRRTDEIVAGGFEHAEPPGGPHLPKGALLKLNIEAPEPQSLTFDRSSVINPMLVQAKEQGRQEARASEPKPKSAAKFTAGDRVKLPPHAYGGATGVVTGVRDETAIIWLDQPMGTEVQAPVAQLAFAEPPNDVPIEQARRDAAKEFQLGDRVRPTNARFFPNGAPSGVIELVEPDGAAIVGHDTLSGSFTYWCLDLAKLEPLPLNVNGVGNASSIRDGVHKNVREALNRTFVPGMTVKNAIDQAEAAAKTAFAHLSGGVQFQDSVVFDEPEKNKIKHEIELSEGQSVTLTLDADGSDYARYMLEQPQRLVSADFHDEESGSFDVLIESDKLGPLVVALIGFFTDEQFKDLQKTGLIDRGTAPAPPVQFFRIGDRVALVSDGRQGVVTRAHEDLETGDVRYDVSLDRTLIPAFDLSADKLRKLQEFQIGQRVRLLGPGHSGETGVVTEKHEVNGERRYYVAIDHSERGWGGLFEEELAEL